MTREQLEKQMRAERAAYMREWNKRNPEKVRKSYFKKYKKTYGREPVSRPPVTRENVGSVILERRVINSNGCWEWTGAKSSFGHGLVRYKESNDIPGRGKLVRVHRLAAMLWKGLSLDDPLHVCHDCPGGDNPVCFNPKHLFIGTQRDNIQDAIKKGTFKQKFKIGNRSGR